MSRNTLSPGLRWAAVALLLALAGCSSSNQTTEPATPAQTASAPSAAKSGAASAKPGPTKPGSSAPANPDSSTPAKPGSSSAARKPPPPATTPVPPATPGGVNDTVPSRPEKSQRPVQLDKPSQTGTGLTAGLVSIKSINAKAQLPGEIAGPALAITVEVKNNSSQAADLNTSVVTLQDSKKAPGGEMTASPARPLKGRLAPGDSSRGVYVFAVPENARKPIIVNVTISNAPVLVFTGNAN